MLKVVVALLVLLVLVVVLLLLLLLRLLLSLLARCRRLVQRGEQAAREPPLLVTLWRHVVPQIVAAESGCTLLRSTGSRTSEMPRVAWRVKHGASG